MRSRASGGSAFSALSAKKIVRRGISTMQSVVITGASTGIGWATAKLLLDRGFRVFGSVRKQADAHRLKGELGAHEFRRQMDVNVVAPIIAAHAFGPLRGSDPALKGPRGRIVMMRSVA